MDIDSSYTDYLNNIVSNTTSGASSAKLSNSVSSTDYANATDDELMDACKQFESYFVEQMLKEMEKTVPTDELDEGSNSQLIDYYKDSLTQQYSKDSTERGGLGIAQTLYQQMKRNYAAVPDETGTSQSADTSNTIQE